MATRAERFKATVERSGPKKPATPTRKPKKSAASSASEPAPKEPAAKKKATAKKAPAKKATAKKAEPAARRVEGSEHTAERNVSKHAGRKAPTALEDSETGKPSRRSTRASKNRGLPSDNLQRRAKNKAATPEARAAKARAKTKKTR